MTDDEVRAAWNTNDFETLKVGDPFTQEWLDRVRGLIGALNAARRAIHDADDWLSVGVGVGLRYYIPDMRGILAEFDASLAEAGVTLRSERR